MMLLVAAILMSLCMPSYSYCEFRCSIIETARSDCLANACYAARMGLDYCCSTNVGMIVGILIGIVVVIAGLIALCYFCCCRNNNNNVVVANSAQQQSGKV